MKSSKISGVLGYVVKDNAGIVAIFPNYADDDFEAAMHAERYVKKHRILEVVEKRRDEDEFEFKIRLNQIAGEWKKRKEKFMN